MKNIKSLYLRSAILEIFFRTTTGVINIAKRLAPILLFFISAYGPAVYSQSIEIGDIKGLPGIVGIMEELILQTEDLQAQIDALGTGGGGGPIEVTVNCPTDSITAVLAQEADSSAPLTINVRGVCTETVLINRDNVTLQGNSTADGIKPPPELIDTNTTTVVVENGATNIALNSMFINGSFDGLAVRGGSNVVASGIEVSNATRFGIVSVSGSEILLIDSYIHNNFIGVISGFSGNFAIQGGVIEFNSLSGVFAVSGGTGVLSNLTLQGNQTTPNIGPVVRDNLIGVFVRGASSIFLVGTTIENNNASGIFSEPNGAVEFGGGNDAHNIIRNNGGDGVFVGELSSVMFLDNSNEITGNGGLGIACDPTSAYRTIGGSPGIVTGNGAGNISPDCN